MNLTNTTIFTTTLLVSALFVSGHKQHAVASDQVKLLGDDPELIFKFEKCKDIQCLPLTGTLKKPLEVFKGDTTPSNIGFTVMFEKCSAEVKNLTYTHSKNLKWGEHVVFHTTDKSTLTLECANNRLIHKRFALANADGEPRLKLRKFEGSYRHLGHLQVQVIPLTYQ